MLLRACYVNYCKFDAYLVRQMTDLPVWCTISPGLACIQPPLFSTPLLPIGVVADSLRGSTHLFDDASVFAECCHRITDLTGATACRAPLGAPHTSAIRESRGLTQMAAVTAANVLLLHTLLASSIRPLLFTFGHIGILLLACWFPAMRVALLAKQITGTHTVRYKRLKYGVLPYHTAHQLHVRHLVWL